MGPRMQVGTQASKKGSYTAGCFSATAAASKNKKSSCIQFLLSTTEQKQQINIKHHQKCKYSSIQA
jgi:hypothetical protein